MRLYTDVSSLYDLVAGGTLVGWCAGPGSLTNLDYRRPTALAVGADGCCLVYHFYLLSPSLWETA